MVSFSSAEDALSNDVKNDIFNSQGTENLPFRFWGDTRYIYANNTNREANESNCVIIQLNNGIIIVHHN